MSSEDGSASGGGKYKKYEQVTVTAAPKDGYLFMGWYDGDALISKKTVYPFKMPKRNLTLTAKFEKEVTDGFQKGLGTESDPYIILTKNQLIYLGKNVNGDTTFSKDKYFALGADINLDGMEWIPIGKDSTYLFSGIFDGGGYIISNFRITESKQYFGLFGYNKGIIKNIEVESFIIDVSHSGSNVIAGGLVGDNQGTIDNSCAKGNISMSVSSFDAYAGGLVGINDTNGIIKDSHATGNISAAALNPYAGGLVGYVFRATINNCYATGDVNAISFLSSSLTYSYAGGLVGYNYYGNINNNYATGNISAKSTASASVSVSYAGGLVGYTIYGTINNSYATGDIKAESIAVSSAYALAHAGGLIGRTIYSVINCSYAIGNISAVFSSNSASSKAYAGGFIGDNLGTLTNCYRYSGQVFYRKDNSGTFTTANNTDGTELNLLTEFEDESFYLSTLKWDSAVWDFSGLDFANGKYPSLRILSK